MERVGGGVEFFDEKSLAMVTGAGLLLTSLGCMAVQGGPTDLSCSLVALATIHIMRATWDDIKRDVVKGSRTCQRVVSSYLKITVNALPFWRGKGLVEADKGGAVREEARD